jgi:hypothetical protein
VVFGMDDGGDYRDNHHKYFYKRPRIISDFYKCLEQLEHCYHMAQKEECEKDSVSSVVIKTAECFTLRILGIFPRFLEIFPGEKYDVEKFRRVREKWLDQMDTGSICIPNYNSLNLEALLDCAKKIYKKLELAN